MKTVDMDGARFEGTQVSIIESLSKSALPDSKKVMARRRQRKLICPLRNLAD